MSFLKKLGNILRTVTGLFTGFAPIVQTQIPQSTNVIATVSRDLAAIGNVVVAVEASGQLVGMTGPDKAKFIAPQVAQIILASSLVAGKKIDNQEKFLEDCGKLGGVIADILNDIHQSAVIAVTDKVDH